jgi:hypothetical protein
MVGDILIFCTAILIFCIFVSVAKDISNSSQKDDNKKNIKKYVDETYRFPTELELKALEQITFSLTKNKVSVSLILDNCSCGIRNKNMLYIGNEVFPKDDFREGIYNSILDNIDYCYDMKRDEFEKIPKFLISYFHELSHLVGHSQEDRSKDSYLIMIADNESYRKVPTEKLADNLAYALIANNKQQIFDIFGGRESIANQERNLQLVKEYHKKYIPQ